ncbi:ABC transporter substrate-binding protein [Gynuella sunshinyii]|uniref:ABC-type sugar transport system, periplasmic component n=1 Tax=Gynuella sunshinyii YC6258 TaxID=1445510 RepID=A0A0C5VL71_9GAMM|nr:ABC transporter substrate-binding protein [Gynuella sunshinyii]AJQ95056.1 ABC-type sugar transport system, periplasmic component [Gynuella sunshinyii YC6258]
MKIETLALTTAVFLSLVTTAQADTLKFECGVVGNSGQFCQYVKTRFEAETPHTLEFVEFPSTSTDKLGVLQQVLASGDGDVVDVFSVDVVWPGIIGEYFLDLTESIDDLKNNFFATPWNNNLVNGRLKAIPGMVDTGVLFYRTDLLQKYGESKPQTWADMTRIAEKVQAGERAEGNRKFWGLVFQGKAYEGLSCNALEWIASYGGGTIVDNEGRITVDNARAAAALDMAASWIGHIAPQGVLGYQEEEARAVFQNGDAMFMRNWPYAFVLGQDDSSPIKGKIGLMPLPAGDSQNPHAATLGGWQWAVNRNSDHKEAAIALIRILGDVETQIQRFLVEGASPANKYAYQDPRILAKAPYMEDMLAVFETSVARPATVTGTRYNQVSNAFFNSVFSVLNGDITGTEAVKKLNDRLVRIKRKAW